MKVMVAGASGAIGQPLIDALIADGHEVFGITQSQERALVIAGKGARPLVLDVLDKKKIIAAFSEIKPEVVIDMLTHLPKEYTPIAMREAAEMDAKIRMEGGGNLLAAAKAHGTKRYISQSCGFWYEQGTGLADESVPFAANAPPGIAAGIEIYTKIEKRALEAEGIEGVALRFGFFYGPGTWFHPRGNVADQIRKRLFPVIGKGEGIWNFIHIEDAAKAAASAIYCHPGAYNIVNNRPAPMKEWLQAFARYLDAPQPPWISVEEGLEKRGAEAVYYAEKLRGATNSKAKQQFNFQPRTFEWLL